MRVFDFDTAIVRLPGATVVDGLRAGAGPSPGFAGVVAEHAAYVAALTAAGVTVDILPPLDAFPDAIFVEDPALVFGEGAILLNPGAPTRAGEAAALAPALARHFGAAIETLANGHADGGDILVTPREVLIGLSARTDAAGADALAHALARLGRMSRIIGPPPGALHLKTAIALVDEDAVLATRACAEAGIVEDMRVIVVPDGEEAAANALRVNDVVLVGSRFPRTIDLLDAHGFAVVPLDTREIGLIDAGLSCMSLRWHPNR